MAQAEELSTILKRIAEGQDTEADRQQLQDLLNQDDCLPSVLQVGKYTVNIQQALGQVHIGDRLELTEENIQAIAQAIRNEIDGGQSDPPIAAEFIDELVQEVRSRLTPIEQQRHGTMLLWRVNEPVPVDEIYVDVEILERPAKEFSSDKDGLLQTFQPDDRASFYTMGLGKPGRRLAGMQAVEQSFDRNLNLMVLGLPGSGKTTFLQHLLMQCLGGNIPFLAHRIPILMRLRDYDFGSSFGSTPSGNSSVDSSLQSADHSTLMAHIRGCLDICSDAAFDALFQEGRLWILLDGLDEVPKADSKLVIHQIEQLVSRCGHNRIVVSCRTQATEHRFRQCLEVQIADFNETQVQQFAQRWFTAIAPPDQKSDARQQAHRFVQQLDRPENQQIRDLAVTPILLNLTCAVFRDRDGRFYSKRSDLYREGLRLLLQDWDASRSIDRQPSQYVLNIPQKERLLSHVALQKFQQSQYVLFDEDELTEAIATYLGQLPNASADWATLQADSTVIRQSIAEAHGLFIQRAASLYSFSHLTFQEYFTAREIVTSTKHHGSFDVHDLVQHVGEKRWYEVFLLTVDMLGNADELIRLIKQQIDQQFGANAMLQEFLNLVEQVAQQVEAPYHPTAIRALYFDFLRDKYMARAVDESLSIVQDKADSDQIDARLAFEYTQDVARGLKSYLSKTKDLTIARVLDQNLAIALNLARDVELAQFMRVAQTNPQLQADLQLLRESLADPRDWQTFERWWTDHGDTWIEQVRATMVVYKSLEVEVQLTEKQTEQLQQYYDANKLLVDCMASGVVSDRVKQEIEASLLRPVMEVKKSL